MTTNQATDSTKPAEREELMPCPFCGEPSDLTVHVYGNGEDDAYVQCRECTTCGPDGGDRAGAITKWNHRALLAAGGKAGGEVVAWRTFDGEGGYEYRSYEDNENYRDEFIKRNGPNYADWVEPLYTRPQQAAQVAQPLTPDQLADRCESWLHSAIPITSVVDAFESGFRDAEQFHGIGKDKAS